MKDEGGGMKAEVRRDDFSGDIRRGDERSRELTVAAWRRLFGRQFRSLQPEYDINRECRRVSRNL
jgi:hypothetical protein